MEQRHSERVSASANCHTSRVHFLPSCTNGLYKLTSLKRFVLPVAVLSTAFLLGIGHLALASTATTVAASVAHSIPAPPGVEGPVWWLLTHLPQAHNPFQPIVDLVNNTGSFFNHLPNNIGKWSIDLMELLYKLAADLLLKTPTWIFDNEWFKNTTLMFSASSIGITSVLTMLEGIKRMLSGLQYKNGKKIFKFIKSQPMDVKDIAKRWGLVSLGLLGVPWAFKTAFSGLNWVSNKLIDMNVDLMDAQKLAHMDWFNVITMGVFDVVLISTLIPTLWKNGKRFFDLLVLAMVGPLALTAWVFDDYRAFYYQWWNNVKKLSVVQIYHGIFLLIIGWFIFGISTPMNPLGMIVKLLIVTGGFARMQNPPDLFGIRTKMNPQEVIKLPKNGDIQRGIGNGFKDSNKKLSGPVGLIEKFVGKNIITNPTGWLLKKSINLVPPIMRKGGK